MAYEPMHAIATLASGAESLRAYREGVLAAVRACVRYDGALYHAMSPRVSLESAVFVGLRADVIARSQRTWDDLAVALSPMRDAAERELVVTDAVFTPGSAARSVFRASIERPLERRSLCMVHLVVRSGLIGGIALFGKRRNAFDAPAVDLLRRLAPLIAVGDALHQRLDAVAQAPQRTRLECRDERLTARERQIVVQIALGRTNADIARALDLSPNTVRNHVARIASRLDASNRAEIVRLAVLTHAPAR